MKRGNLAVYKVVLDTSHGVEIVGYNASSCAPLGADVALSLDFSFRRVTKYLSGCFWRTVRRLVAARVVGDFALDHRLISALAARLRCAGTPLLIMTLVPLWRTRISYTHSALHVRIYSSNGDDYFTLELL